MRLAPESVTCFSHGRDQFGESPFWDEQAACLWWVDISGHSLRSRTLDGSERRWEFDQEPGCIAPTRDGRILIAMRTRLILFDPRDGSRAALCEVPWDPATTRSNDGRCDPAGRFWVGTVFEPKTAPEAGLYCLRQREGRTQLVQELSGNLTANGLAFSPDGQFAWWSNTPEHRILRYPYDAAYGHFGTPQMFRSFPRREAGTIYGGRPDGAAVDSEGAYWVAMYEGGRVLRLGPDGTTLLELELPATATTMACLGGPRLRTLFVTTAHRGRPDAELAAQPWAGHVLAVELDSLGLPPQVHGLPVARYDPAA